MIKTIKCTKSQCTKSHTQSHIANTSNLLPFYSNFFHMLSTTSNYFQFTSNLLPVTSYLLPITSNLLPVTSYLLPITSNLLSISSNFFQFTSNGPYDNLTSQRDHISPSHLCMWTTKNDRVHTCSLLYTTGRVSNYITTFGQDVKSRRRHDNKMLLNMEEIGRNWKQIGSIWKQIGRN